MVRIGVDIGGTFTDFAVVDGDDVTLWKEDTTPANPADAITKGLEAIASRRGEDVRRLLERTEVLVHGTTIATNALIQRNQPDAGLLCTSGFRDVLYLRDAYKPERFNIHLPHPRPYVDRYLRLAVSERIGADGSVLTPLSEEDVRTAAETFREADVASVAVAFLWSIVNSAHERRAAEILAEELPGVHIVASHEILPEIREWERTSATSLSAYILPAVAEYLTDFRERMQSNGLRHEPLIMQNNGGCGEVRDVLRRPVQLVASGPAAAPAAAIHHGRVAGATSAITIDMGGTSLDVCVVTEGETAMSRTLTVAEQPIGVAGVEVSSIGAGGGSIAWLDSGGALRVGPRSAGAVPGPAAYGLGGDQPTVTDANVVLGYLRPDAFLGGRRALDGDAAERAVRTVSEPLGLDATAGAAGIIRVVNSNMVGAIRAVSVERGVDPREYTLVAGGGAGGLHATALARELGMKRVLIPREAGTLCAFGMTVTDVRQDATAPYFSTSDTVDLRRVDEMFAELEAAVSERLRRAGLAQERIRLQRQVDARYPGQVHDLTVSIPTAERYAEEDVASMVEAFHREHDRVFTYARRDLGIEFVHWRVTGTVKVAADTATPAASTNGGGRRASARETELVFFPAAEAELETGFYPIGELELGTVVDGPAVIQAPTTTILLGPGDSLTVGAAAHAIVVGN